MTIRDLSRDQLLDIIQKQADLTQQQSERIEALEQQLRFLLHQKHKPSSEKISADQLKLFDSQQVIEPAPEEQDEEDKITIAAFTRKKRGGRKACDESLERHRIEYNLPEDQCTCGCGEPLVKIGDVTSEQYEVIPARYIVIEHVQHQYACKACRSKEALITAPKTPQILPKSQAAAGLLAHITTLRFVDGVPFHRQEKVHERGGIHIPRNTMARNQIKLGEAVLPLINLFEDAIRAGPYTHCDETPIQVLKEEGRNASNKSWIWVRKGGLPGQEAVLFTYSPSRSSEVVKALFEDYHGTVQCDGYAAYTCLEDQGVTLIACMAHARRKFNDALKQLSKKEQSQQSKAAIAIRYFKQLYAIESETRDANMTPQQRYTHRQEKAIPVLNTFKDWLDQQTVLPKSPLGKAIQYTLNQWNRLIRYCDDGMLEIDNNRVERAIRPVAIGRSNWMFADTPNGAHTNARFYSLIETCKLHGLEPYAYLKHIFKELPKAQTIEAYEALLPWNLDADTLRESAQLV